MLRIRRLVQGKLGGLPRGVIEHLMLQSSAAETPRCTVPESAPRYLLGGTFRQPPPKASSVIRRADRICRHVFDRLGCAPVPGSDSGPGYRPIQWHTDLWSGYRWAPRTLPPLIRVGDRSGVDIIRAWELSRMQHLICLGQAHALTDDPKYALEYKHQIGDWIGANPRFRGVNWMTSMDAGLRAVSWLVGLDILQGAPEIRGDRSFLQRLHRSIQEHGRFIHLRCRSKSLLGQDTTNHHVVAVAGLLFISVLSPASARSTGWRRFAVRELLKCAREQVHPDGWDYEASTSYHLLVLEAFLHSLVLCERAGIGGIEPLRDTVRRMSAVLADSLRSTGIAPQIGDNDSGRFLILGARPVLDHGYVLGLASTLFNDPALKTEGAAGAEEIHWLFGEDERRRFEDLPVRRPCPTSRSFPDAGWHTIREGDVYCFISCGPNGQGGLGGHAHNDKLSFELDIGGVSLVVDPGSPAYTSSPELRNEYRSTRLHNTFYSPGREQNPITRHLFYLENGVEIVESRIERERTRVVYRGEIVYGCVRHRRTISVDPQLREVAIRDEIGPEFRPGGFVSLHLAPGIDYEDGRLVNSTTGIRVAGLRVRSGEPRKERYFYSPEYGVRVEARRLVVEPPTGNSRAVTEVVICG